MNNSVIITLDQGSSSSRALAIDSAGRVVAQATRALQTIRPAEGLAEIEVSSLLEDQLAVLHDLCAQITNRCPVCLGPAMAGGRQRVGRRKKMLAGRPGQVLQRVSASCRPESFHPAAGR